MDAPDPQINELIGALKDINDNLHVLHTLIYEAQEEKLAWQRNLLNLALRADAGFPKSVPREENVT